MKLLQNKSDFPPGLTSLTNIQRQFFDSFVGQTFQVVPASSFQLQMPTRIGGDSMAPDKFFFLKFGRKYSIITTSLNLVGSVK